MRGLIEDLQNRRLTGCRGCDAVRRVLYRRFESIEKAKQQQAEIHAGIGAFDASPLGAFIESPLHARGLDDVALPWALVEIRDFGTGVIRVTVRLHGDSASALVGSEALVYDATDTLVCTLPVGTPSFINVAATLASTSTDGTAKMQTDAILTPAGFTTALYQDNVGLGLVDIGIASHVLIRNASTMAEIIDLVDMTANYISEETSGSQDFQTYVSTGIPCWSDVTLDTLGTLSAIFRWTKVDLGGGDFAIRPKVGANQASEFSNGNWRFYYNGTTDFIEANVTFQNGQLPFELCSGGTWPPSGTFRGVSDFDQIALPAGVEPLTIDQVRNTGARIWNGFSLQPSQTYANL